MSDIDLPLAVRMMQDGYLMQIDALQDENERLRSCLSDSAENSKQIMHEAHVQEEENAKLRELVKDMWRFTGAACKRYPRLFDQSAQGGQMVMPNMLDSFERRMRELGIEVDA